MDEDYAPQPGQVYIITACMTGHSFDIGDEVILNTNGTFGQSGPFMHADGRGASRPYLRPTEYTIPLPPFTSITDVDAFLEA